MQETAKGGELQAELFAFLPFSYGTSDCTNYRDML